MLAERITSLHGSCDSAERIPSTAQSVAYISATCSFAINVLHCNTCCVASRTALFALRAALHYVPHSISQFGRGRARRCWCCSVMSYYRPTIAHVLFFLFFVLLESCCLHAFVSFFSPRITKKHPVEPLAFREGSHRLVSFMRACTLRNKRGRSHTHILHRRVSTISSMSHS